MIEESQDDATADVSAEPQKAQLAIPMSDETFTKFKSLITASERKRKELEPGWEKNVLAMQGDSDKVKVDSEFDIVAVNKDWPRTKQKIAQLMYRVPKVQLRPRQEQFKAVVPLFQEVLNYYLKDKVEAHHVMDEVLTDAINASGFGVSKIAYEASYIEKQIPKYDVATLAVENPALAEAISAGIVPNPPVNVPQIVHEEYSWERISPKHFIWPTNFKKSNFDKAPWLGFEFRKPLSEAKRLGWVDDNFSAITTDFDEGLSDSKQSPVKGEENFVKGWEIWYRAKLYDPTVAHPKKLRRLVILEGVDQPVVHEDSPYQREVPAPDGSTQLIGVTRFPIRVLTLTYISDRALPPSDSTISRPQVNELWRSRSQMILQRERSLPIRWYDTNRVDPDVQEQLNEGTWQGFVPMNGPADGAIGEIARAQYPRENFEFDNVANRDLDEAWMMGSAQIGARSASGTTAAEINTIQANINVRLDYERDKVLRFFCQGVEVLGQLLQLFHTNSEQIQVPGPDGQPQFVEWNNLAIAGDFVYEVEPDSSLRVDVVQDRADAVKLYQMTANDPNVNRVPLLEWVFRRHNLDPGKILVQQLPEAKPEPPKINFSFKGEDLFNPIVLSILNQLGVQLDPNLVQATLLQQGVILAGKQGQSPAQTEHGGAAEQQEPLSKHQLDKRGL